MLIRTIFPLTVKSFLTHNPLWFLLTLQTEREICTSIWEAHNQVLKNCDECESFS